MPVAPWPRAACLARSGCRLAEAFLGALSRLGDKPRLAFSTQVTYPGAAQGRTTAAVHTAAIDTGDAALNLRPVPPFDGRPATVQAIVGHPSGTRQAAKIYEPVDTLEFDIWNRIHDRDLGQGVSAYDDILGAFRDVIAVLARSTGSRANESCDGAPLLNLAGDPFAGILGAEVADGPY